MNARAFALTAMGVVFVAGNASAATIYVGECVPDGSHLPTIQQAVDAVSNPGTVKICPGAYPEQVVIDNKQVSLVGLQGTTTSSAIKLVAPGGGLVQNTTSVFDSNRTYAAQIVVRNAAGVTLSGLTVDGSNNQVTGCADGLVGIIFQNASGSVATSVVSNHMQSPEFQGCQNGLAIYVQSDGGAPRAVAVSDSFVSNFQKNGITGNGEQLTMTITGNTVVGPGPTDGAATNSIQIGFGATGSVTRNTVGDNIWAPLQPNDPGNAAAGILVYAAPGVTVSQNTVTNTQFGIAIEGDEFSGHSDGATVSKNHVGATRVFDGIDICGSSNAGVHKNVVSGSGEAGIHIDSACGTPSTGNSVTGNTINGGCAGVLVGPGSSSPALNDNKIYNADTRLMTGGDTCPATSLRGAAKALAPKAARRGSPAR